MKALSKSLVALLSTITLLSSPIYTTVAHAASGNTNGGVFDAPFNVTPDKSENKLTLNITTSVGDTNGNVELTAYGSQSVAYIVRYAKVKIPIFELKESNKNAVGVAKITIPDLNVTLVGSGTGSGSVSGSVSGNISGTASGSINGNYSSYPWYGSGSGTVSGTVSGNVFGNVAGTINIPLNGSMSGTIKSPGTITGTSTTNIPVYELVEKQSAEYNVPYVIPIYTEIVDPSGSVKDGNICKYTATANGTYNFTIRDTLGNSETKSIYVSNIKKGAMDVTTYNIKKQYNNGNVIRSVEEADVSTTGTVRAYAFGSDASNSKVTYGYFLKVKEVASIDIPALEDNGAGALRVKEISIGVSPTDFYSTPASAIDVSAKFPTLASLADGIYLDTTKSNGYRLMFVKETRSKIMSGPKITHLTLKNTAGTTTTKTYKVEIEDKPSAYITAKNNFILDSSGKSTAIFTRELKPTLNLVSEVYDVVNYKTQAMIRKTGTNEIIRQEPTINISNDFKDTSIKDFNITVDKNVAIQNYDIGAIVSNTELRATSNILYNSNFENTLTVVYAPIDTMLDTSNMIKTENTTTSKITVTPTLKNTKIVQDLLTKYNMKVSDFKIAYIDYSNVGGGNVIKLKDLTTLEAALESPMAKPLGQETVAAFNTTSDIRLAFGIPGKFIDVIPLNSGIDVSLYNIENNEPVIQNVSDTEPFNISIVAESGDFKYTLPRDLQKMKDDGQITRITLIKNYSKTVELLDLSEEEVSEALKVTSESSTLLKVVIYNKYNATATDIKTLNIIHGDTLKNSARLDNDPSILLTKKGIYDMHTKKLTPYKISYNLNSDTGITLKGIRLSNNNIVVVSTESNSGEIFTSSLQSLGKFTVPGVPCDIVQYGESVLIATKTTKPAIFKADNVESIIGKTLPIEDTLPSPINCLERLNSYLLVGGEGAQALRVYITNKDGGYTLKESLSADEIFEGSSTKIKDMTVRNNKLELYPGDSSNNGYYVIIELP